jgi:hypothetical protein
MPKTPGMLAADPTAIRGVLDVVIVGLPGVVQEALPDLRSTTKEAVLSTNSAFGEMTPVRSGRAYPDVEPSLNSLDAL